MSKEAGNDKWRISDQVGGPNPHPHPYPRFFFYKYFSAHDKPKKIPDFPSCSDQKLDRDRMGRMK